ncbi:VC0807 family protein [Caulobacter sp. S45]|uniref:VC0807 family protein n=1 Tax=Caulobacter sp. S45 TaxID=1641861 RepID=UPI00157533D3|nr:VC0807 family protein [Caulobacter sp. S45]
MTDLVVEQGARLNEQSEAAALGKPLDQVLGYMRKNGVKLGTEVLVNFVLPYVIYDQAKPTLGDVNALIASSGPPVVWSLVEFARRRRVDALSMLVLGGIVLSVLAVFGGGSVHLLQLREKLVTVLIGMVFLGSAAIGRPLVYQLARARMMRSRSSELAAFEGLRDNAFFRRSMTLMTLVWGFGLVGEAALSCTLVYTISVREYLVVGPIMGNATMGALGLWTFWYSRRQRRLGQARREALAATTSHPSLRL